MGERHETEHKRFEEADETREFPNGRAEILKIGGGEVGRLVFEPGWRWSNDVKPSAGTDSSHDAWVVATSRRSSTGTGPATTRRAASTR